MDNTTKTTVKRVMLNDVTNLKTFVAVTETFDFDVDLRSSTNSRYVIDAKSILGCMSLDLSKPCICEVHETGAAADAYFKAIGHLIVGV